MSPAPIRLRLATFRSAPTLLATTLLAATLLAAASTATAQDPAAPQPAAQQPGDGGVLGFLRSDTAAKYDLDPAAPDELLGVVVDKDDQGVAGATVYLRPKGTWNAKTLRQTVTDPRGQFTFRRLEVGAYNVAAVSGARSSRTEYRKWQAAVFKPDVNREPVVLRLKPAGQATIRVVDAATKAPLPGAKIRLGYWDLPRDRVADDKGQMLVEGLPPRSYEFSATAEGYAKNTAGASFKTTPNATVVLELSPGAVLIGTARDPDGNPIGRPRPHLRDPDDPGMFFDYTPGNAEGEFRFGHVPIGMSILLDFARDGYIEPNTVVRPLKAGETRRVDVTLEPAPTGGSVIGVVKDTDGNPVSGAKVAVEWQDDRLAFTDQQGRFRIDDIDQRRDSLVVRASGFATSVARFTKGTADRPGEAMVELEPGNEIHARVVDEQGQPIVGAYVEFPTSFSHSSKERLRTDKNGEFRSSVAPKDARFRIYASGYSDRDRTELPLNTAEVVEVVLAPEGFIKGVAVDDATGEAIPTFNVRMNFSPDRKAGDPSGGIGTDWDSPGRKYSSPEGRFEIDDLVIGQPMIVTVEAEGYRPASIRRIEAGRPEDEARSEFRLRPIDPESLIEVAGTITTAGGKPIPGVEVRLVASIDGTDSRGQPLEWYRIKGEVKVDDRVPQMMRAATDEQGRFRFEGVYSDCVVELAYWGVGAAGGRLKGIEEMSPEERTSLAIETTAPATLSVTFDAEAFPSVGGVQLLPAENERGGDRNNLTDWNADGGWRIDGIVPGEYRFLVTRREYHKDRPGVSRLVTIHEQVLRFAAGEEKALRLDQPTLQDGE